ncbi:putative surface protease GP63, partial [Trypanosoma theileri]
YYTALTMSTFEGLGYYKANWGMEEPMSWGHKSGCNFLNGSCTENEKHYPKQFCSDATSRCTSDRSAYGKCYRGQQREYQGPNDVCRVIGSFTEGNDNVKTYTYCTGAETNALPGSLMGPDSWCLDGEGLQVQNAGESAESLSGVCARVSCDEGRRAVEVQYKGSDTFKECPEGTSIDVESSAFQSGGKIKCPKYDEVCTITPDGRSRLSMNVEPDSTRRAAALSALVPLAMTFTLMGLL